MHRVTSNHVYADELITVHSEHVVKTGMQQDLKRERPVRAPPPVGKSLQAQQDKQVTRTLRSMQEVT
jgi:hypothetical protein